MTVVFDGEIAVRAGNWSLAAPGHGRPSAFDIPFANLVNGLVDGSVAGRLTAWTGTLRGPVPVVVEVHDTAPDDDDGDDVVEVSWTPPGVRVELLDGRGATIATVRLQRPGPYRVRYRVRGLDPARERQVRGPDDPEVDRCWLHLWPAPSAPDVVVRAGPTAAAWHAAVRAAPHVTTEREHEALVREAAERRRAENAERNRIAQLEQWAGRLPGSRITGDPERYGGLIVLAPVDRDLVDVVEDLPDDDCRRLAIGVVGALAERTGLGDDLPAVADALADLAAGRPLRAPFTSTPEAWAACGGPPVPGAPTGWSGTAGVARSGLVGRAADIVVPTPRQHVAMAIVELGYPGTGLGALSRLVSRARQVVDADALAALVRAHLPAS